MTTPNTSTPTTGTPSPTTGTPSPTPGTSDTPAAPSAIRADEPAAEIRSDVQSFDPSPGVVLEMRNVSYSYTKGGKRVLRHINHRFRAGRMYAITGPSGAGKTTMLSLISGLTNPSEGEVLYRGRNLADQDRYHYRSHDIGVVFQSFNLLPGLTVAENIILSMDAAGKRYPSKRERAVALLEQVHLPAAYAHERILHLSGGEQQRVAIARALSTDPHIIVTDEPTGNLDMATQEDIMDIFRSMAHDAGRCVIIVTHSPEVAHGCDETFALSPLRQTSRRSAVVHDGVSSIRQGDGGNPRDTISRRRARRRR
ncbi:ABC transporter ATP-binding protein [Bifidobacterium mongoliense]|uniref:ABC transporter ATP-binding protein n=2 Tax=Bifidobacterium mongoliense TaxID=518643 RepID=UPI0030EF9EF4